MQTIKFIKTRKHPTRAKSIHVIHPYIFEEMDTMLVIRNVSFEKLDEIYFDKCSLSNKSSENSTEYKSSDDSLEEEKMKNNALQRTKEYNETNNYIKGNLDGNTDIILENSDVNEKCEVEEKYKNDGIKSNKSKIKSLEINENIGNKGCTCTKTVIHNKNNILITMHNKTTTLFVKEQETHKIYISQECFEGAKKIGYIGMTTVILYEDGTLLYYEKIDEVLDFYLGDNIVVVVRENEIIKLDHNKSINIGNYVKKNTEINYKKDIIDKNQINKENIDYLEVENADKIEINNFCDLYVIDEQRLLIIEKQRIYITDYKEILCEIENNIYEKGCKYFIGRIGNVIIISSNIQQDLYGPFVYIDIDRNEEYAFEEAKYGLKIEMDDEFELLHVKSMCVFNDYVYILDKGHVNIYVNRKEEDIEIVNDLTIVNVDETKDINEKNAKLKDQEKDKPNSPYKNIEINNLFVKESNDMEKNDHIGYNKKESIDVITIEDINGDIDNKYTSKDNIKEDISNLTPGEHDKNHNVFQGDVDRDNLQEIITQSTDQSKNIIEDDRSKKQNYLDEDQFNNEEEGYFSTDYTENNKPDNSTFNKDSNEESNIIMTNNKGDVKSINGIPSTDKNDEQNTNFTDQKTGKQPSLYKNKTSSFSFEEINEEEDESSSDEIKRLDSPFTTDYFEKEINTERQNKTGQLEDMESKNTNEIDYKIKETEDEMGDSIDEKEDNLNKEAADINTPGFKTSETINNEISPAKHDFKHKDFKSDDYNNNSFNFSEFMPELVEENDKNTISKNFDDLSLKNKIVDNKRTQNNSNNQMEENAGQKSPVQESDIQFSSKNKTTNIDKNNVNDSSMFSFEGIKQFSNNFTNQFTGKNIKNDLSGFQDKRKSTNVILNQNNENASTNSFIGFLDRERKESNDFHAFNSINKNQQQFKPKSEIQNKINYENKTLESRMIEKTYNYTKNNRKEINRFNDEYIDITNNLEDELNSLIQEFKGLKPTRIEILPVKSINNDELIDRLESIFNDMYDIENNNLEKNLEYKIDLLEKYLTNVKPKEVKETIKYFDSYIRELNNSFFKIPFQFYNFLSEGMQVITGKETNEDSLTKKIFDDLDKMSIAGGSAKNGKEISDRLQSQKGIESFNYNTGILGKTSNTASFLFDNNDIQNSKTMKDKQQTMKNPDLIENTPKNHFFHDKNSNYTNNNSVNNSQLAKTNTIQNFKGDIVYGLKEQIKPDNPFLRNNIDPQNSFLNNNYSQNNSILLQPQNNAAKTQPGAPLHENPFLAKAASNPFAIPHDFNQSAMQNQNNTFAAPIQGNIPNQQAQNNENGNKDAAADSGSAFSKFTKNRNRFF